MRLKPYLLFTTCVITICLGILLLTNMHRSAKERAHSFGKAENTLIARANRLAGYGAGFRTALVSLMAREGLDEAAVLSVDFSLPGDPTYGDRPELELFNPDGKNRQPPTAEEFAPYSDAIRFIFTIGNRVFPDGGSSTALVAVLPSLKNDICETLNRLAGAPDLASAAQTIDLTPFPANPQEKNTLHLSEKQYGCIWDGEHNYYAHVLYIISNKED